MILSEGQIKDIIKENPGKARMQHAREYSKKLRRHLYGDGLDVHTPIIKGFERESLHTLRKEYSKSNKDLFSRLGRPIDKVFTAKGGSVYYNLPEEKEKKALSIAHSLPGGYTVRKWVETFWKPHMLDDPGGLIFLEILEKPQAVRAKNSGQSFVYPTYKNSNSIYDYLPNGNKLEWIVFELTKKEIRAAGMDENHAAYRVVDDAFDYYCYLSGGDVIILPGHTYPNYFGKVPAVVNSSIINPSNENQYLSFYDDIIELAEQFFLKGSIKVTHDFLHGFPKYSEFADNCTDCNGGGFVDGKKCESCRGTGKKLITNVKDVKLLTWPASKDDVVILPNQTGGYISPDKIYYEIATADIADLENIMHHTLWGTKASVKTTGLQQQKEGTKTATEVVDDMKPQADRLASISEMAEKVHKFILDGLISLQVSQSYSGSSVSYGRRFILEGPDAIWIKYSDARQKGAPQNVLDTLLNEYNEANYQSDPVGLAIAKKLMYVEPFVHYTAAALKTLNPDPADYKMKLYFSEWLATISEGELLSKDVKQLKESLNVYASTKNIATPEPVAA